ncbi:hypothetical protein ACP4OV_006675 [Aristida adscensionis]
MKVVRSTDWLAEVTELGMTQNFVRHVVDLRKKECSCLEWQMCGKPCNHALALITYSGNEIEKHVDEYFSVRRFKLAYEVVTKPLTEKAQWPKVDTGFVLLPPWMKGSTEKQHKRRRCG